MRDNHSAHHIISLGVALPTPSGSVSPLHASSGFLSIDKSGICIHLQNPQLEPQYHGKYRDPFRAVVHLVLATGPGNPPAVRVQTAKTVRFGSKPVQNLDLLHLGRPNPDPYPSTRGLCRVWLDPSVPISGSSILVFLFMVAIRYPIANRKILTLVYRCPFLMYWLPL